ncbi:MAG: hypothetical protein P8144_10980 [Gammaproteobacteria bacterium]
MNLGQAFWRNFLGSSPPIYKGVVLAFLILNPLALIRFGYTVSAGLILMEFIVLLLMRLACHPLQAGGLIALQAVIMGLTTPAAITEDLLRIYPVFILIIFMLSGILFARELLFVLFTRIFLRIAPQATPTRWRWTRRSRNRIRTTFGASYAVCSCTVSLALHSVGFAH